MLTRRHILTALAAGPLALAPWSARAKDYIDLDWDDLIPDGDGGTLLRTLRGLGVVEHGQLTTGFEQEEARAVTDRYNGMIVRLPGFVVPLDFESTGVTAFILAPFVGACIHVPPPPANQLVLVTTERPYEYEGLYDPVYVTGMFGTAATATALAEIGYAMSAENITPYIYPDQDQ
ncbi:MAG: DUF3299 domain-containing protein [Rhodobacter sp.]|nr:DUF3299 domain-containing protein [Rhodobacter sp.]